MIAVRQEAEADAVARQTRSMSRASRIRGPLATCAVHVRADKLTTTAQTTRRTRLVRFLEGVRERVAASSAAWGWLTL